jgi:hypothetical protein
MNFKGFGRKRQWRNFEVLSLHLPGWADEKHEKPVRIAGLRPEI